MTVHHDRFDRVPLSAAPGSHRLSRSPQRPGRRLGYLVAVAINAILLGLVSVQRDWSEVAFLTADTPRVLGLLKLSLAAGLIVNLVYLLYDLARVRALGDLITSVTGLLAAARILEVFPFDLDQPYSTGARILLIVAVVGSAIGALAGLVSLFRPSRRGAMR